MEWTYDQLDTGTLGFIGSCSRSVLGNDSAAAIEYSIEHDE